MSKKTDIIPTHICNERKTPFFVHHHPVTMLDQNICMGEICVFINTGDLKARYFTNPHNPYPSRIDNNFGLEWKNTIISVSTSCVDN